MPPIHVLDKITIDQIAAGEVIERPSSIVKELVENAIDAGATSVTCEVKNGGIDLIRVTDNGCGIGKNEIPTAFLRHSTSKIENASDLASIESLGFRGEALSSIAAVTRLEMITKTRRDLVGNSYEINGGEEVSFTEIGAPDGTTFLVKDIFYNTPARRKFLKTPMTEASYIADLLEKMALSRPDISFRFIANGQTRLQTSGNGRVRDLIYSIYGRETAASLEQVDYTEGDIHISGFVGRPVIAKGSRAFENYFVNGRYVKDKVIMKAIEEAFRPFMMLHHYPLTVLYIDLPAETFDVNVHPQKMELRFRSEPVIYNAVEEAVKSALSGREFIPDITEEEDRKEDAPSYPSIEPFEAKRAELLKNAPPAFPEKSDFVREKGALPFDTGRGTGVLLKEKPFDPGKEGLKDIPGFENTSREFREKQLKPVQENLFETKLISEEGMKKHRLIGQVFETYWLLQLEDRLYIMDQHAAHEKVLYERKMRDLSEKRHASQMVSPPIMVHLSPREELLLNRYMDAFSELGYEVSSFGGKEYAISAVPYDLYGLDVKSLFEEILGGIDDEFTEKKPEMILSKLASMSCKAAVKGENLLSFAEADALIKELLTLENPYACPHGRPTLISFSRTELDKKFKRII